MKEKLLERVQLIEDAIVRQQAAINQKQQDLQQAMADLNALQGARQEIGYLISQCPEEQPAGCIDPNCNNDAPQDLNGEVV